MNNETRIRADELSLHYAIPVGEFIKDEMEARGLSQTEFAIMLGMEKTKLNKILCGTQSLTAEVALKIEEVWGIPAHIYLDLQSEYELDSAEARANSRYNCYSFSFEGQSPTEVSFNGVELVQYDMDKENRYKTAA